MTLNFPDDLGKKGTDMGGIGSGNRLQSGRLTVGQCLQIKVSDIKKHGLFAKPALWQWRWSKGSTITVDTRLEGWVTLKYTVDEQAREYGIRLENIPQHLGGERVWFTCPNTRCARRCKTLYLRGGYFICRQCQNLGYVSEQASKVDQPFHRISKIRDRLRWTPGYLNGHETKPKGMHWATYNRLVQQHDKYARMLNLTMQRLILRTNTRLNSINKDTNALVNKFQ